MYRSVGEDPGARVGEGTAEEEELDKEFWIKRAGGVSLCVCVCVISISLAALLAAATEQ